jgi:putative ABC transport system substrate-binding protein
MKRREFIAGLASAAAWPLVARAQQKGMPVIGYLHSNSPAPMRRIFAAFYTGLAEGGYVVGQNVTIEYRWAEGHNERLPALALELVNRQVDVIITGGTPAALAAKAATTTIPILFLNASDPVRIGLARVWDGPAATSRVLPISVKG